MKLEELSPRCREVAVLLCQGKERQEIAAELGIAAQTADSHRLTILKRVGARNAVELLRYAIEHGWVPVPGYEQTAGELVDGFDHQPNEV